MNLGRAYNKLGQYNESFRYAEESTKGHYPFAAHLLSIHYLYGEGTKKDREKEIKYLKEAADLGVVVSLKRLIELELEQEFTHINFEQTYQYLQKAINLGLIMNKSLGDFYYRLNEKIKFSMINAQSIADLNLVKLQMYRDNLTLSKRYYGRYLQSHADVSINNKLKEITIALESKSTQKNIQQKIELKKAITGTLKLPNQLEFNYEVGSKFALMHRAKAWKMVSPSEEFLGLKLVLLNKKAKLEDRFGDNTWQTADELWRYIQRYDDKWKLVIEGENDADIISFIQNLRRAMLQTQTKAWVNILGVVK